eukprot:11534239-Ditylum_brightwellii.AAC.1
MAFRRFTNLRKKNRGDLIAKINADVISLNFADRPCNCNSASQVNGACAYKGYIQSKNDPALY